MTAFEAQHQEQQQQRIRRRSRVDADGIVAGDAGGSMLSFQLKRGSPRAARAPFSGR